MGINQKVAATLAEGRTLCEAVVSTLAAATAAITSASVAHCEFARWLYTTVTVDQTTTAKAVAESLKGIPGFSEPTLVYYRMVGQVLAKSPEVSSADFVKSMEQQGYHVAPITGSSAVSLHYAMQVLGKDKAERLILNAPSAVDAAERCITEAAKKPRGARQKSEVDPNLRKLQAALQQIEAVEEQISKGKAVLPPEATEVISAIVASLFRIVPSKEDSEQYLTVDA